MLEAQVELDSGMGDLSFAKAKVHLDGEFSGNIDIKLAVPTAADRDTVVKHLRVKVPGQTEFIDVLGYGGSDRSLELTFHALGLESVPEEVEMFWVKNGEKSLGMLSCIAAPKEEEAPAGQGCGGMILLGAVGLSGLIALSRIWI